MKMFAPGHTWGFFSMSRAPVGIQDPTLIPSQAAVYLRERLCGVGRGLMLIIGSCAVAI